jgi:hypothetical protein
LSLSGDIEEITDETTHSSLLVRILTKKAWRPKRSPNPIGLEDPDSINRGFGSP